MIHKSRIFFLATLALVTLLTACTSASGSNDPQPGKLNVVATTTLVGDVVRNVGGDAIQLTVLLPTGTDPHSFDPSPQDVAKVANAEVIFANGAGLEEFLQPMLENAGSKARIIYVSDGVQLLKSLDVHEPGGSDPHTWFDPNNVIVWTQAIQAELSALDPANAATFATNAQKYQAQLKDLDSWIREQVAQIPTANRALVTDHASFTYFAARYGFQQDGAIVPGYSTLAQPSAQELANLEDAIRKLGVKAVFVGKTVNPALGERLTQDTGTKLIYLYTGSLSDSTGPAATYLDFMHYDVTAIVEALK